MGKAKIVLQWSKATEFGWGGEGAKHDCLHVRCGLCLDFPSLPLSSFHAFFPYPSVLFFCLEPSPGKGLLILHASPFDIISDCFFLNIRRPMPSMNLPMGLRSPAFGRLFADFRRFLIHYFPRHLVAAVALVVPSAELNPGCLWSCQKHK